MKRFLLTAALGVMAASVHAQVTTYSGTGDSGYSGSGTSVLTAHYYNPYGIVQDSKGNVYVTDAMNNGIVILSGGKYYTREGYNNGGYRDGAGSGSSLMTNPQGIVLGANDTLYFVDNGNNAIRRIVPFSNLTKAQQVVTIAGGGDPGVVGGGVGEDGYQDATGLDARFSGPVGIAIAPDKSYLVVTDQYNGLIRKVMLTGANYAKVTTLAGQQGATQAVDGDALTKASFAFPEGVAIASNGDIYIADNAGGLRLLSGGKVTTVLNDTKVENPSTLLLSGDYLYIGNQCNIKRYNYKTKALITLAGSTDFTQCGFKDAKDTIARFDGVGSMILSADAKSLLVTDQNNNRIRQVTLPTSTSIDAITQEEVAFTVFPNPAQSIINIKKAGNGFGQISMSLYDLAGRQVAQTYGNADMSNFQLHVETLPVGVYMLRIEAPGYTNTQRVVISR